jgi:hypothetical protein
MLDFIKKTFSTLFRHQRLGPSLRRRALLHEPDVGLGGEVQHGVVDRDQAGLLGRTRRSLRTVKGCQVRKPFQTVFLSSHNLI